MTRIPDRQTCPVCGSGWAVQVAEYGAVPVFCNVLWPSRTEAKDAAKGDISLAACGTCGLVRNVRFDPSLLQYTQAYENSLHFSSAFQSYAVDLARRLIDGFDVRGRTVVEIGSGKGDFLGLLCDAGAGLGVGYDPSYRDEIMGRDDVTIVPSPYPNERSLAGIALVVSRHVLEHLDEPLDLVRAVREAIPEGSQTGIYIEVPDGGYLLERTALWDVIYEHPSHFTAPALLRVLQEGSFAIHDVRSSFGGQYLSVEGWSLGASTASDSLAPADVVASARGFGAAADGLRTAWGDWLGDHDPEQVALWGVGSKGVTFLNMVRGADGIGSVVDVNVRKHGRHVPGTGQQVVSPESIDRRTERVIIMNPMYEEEVRAALTEMGCGAAITVASTEPDDVLLTA